jgi:hypothetical protein
VSDTFYSKTAADLSDLASASTARANLGLGTAATQASSAFDASGSATAAEAAAIAASLPTLAQATASASAALAVNTVTQVTAAANLTMALPSPVAGALIVVEREAASTANVAVTGNVRGVGSSTVTLSLPSESEMFLGTASTWNPVAGHKTLGSLDSRYGQLATASTYAADQYFGSGRPWFDVRAFGAKGDGTTDDTTAIQTAINTALGLRTDTGVSMSGMSVTDPAAVSGDVGSYVNSPNYPLGCSHITAVTSSPVGYTVATAATTALSGQVVSVGSGSAVTGRIPAGPVFLPSGTYKVSSDLLIQSTLGFCLMGAGIGSTALKASGAGFTTAAVNVDGAADGRYGGFTILGDGTEGTAATGTGGGIPNAFNLTWTPSAQRSTSANNIHDLRVRNLIFVSGVSMASLPDVQTDGTVLSNIVVTGQQQSSTGGWSNGARTDTGLCGTNSTTTVTDTAAVAGDLFEAISGPGIPPGAHITGLTGTGPSYTGYTISASATLTSSGPVTFVIGTSNWQNGFVFGCGTPGNNYDHVLTGCSAARCYTGYYCDASGFALFGAQPGANGVDFRLSPSAQVTIENIQSQASGQLIVSTGSSECPVSVRDAVFAGYTATGYTNSPWISIGTSYGNWVLENLQYTQLHSYEYPAGPTIDLGSADYSASFTLINICQPNPPSAGIVPGAGGGNAAVVCINYQDITGGTRTLYPFYAVNSGFLYQQGIASARPGAGTFGEMFYYATNTGALSHSSGAAWEDFGFSAPSAPDIQWFTSTGTWTKPTGPSPVTTTVYLLGDGGGGGAGAQGATAGTARCGGGGGAGGSLMTRQFVTSQLPSTVAVGIGPGGAGAAGQATSGTAGAAGTNGSGSSFGSLMNAPGAQHGGGGGIAVAGTAGTAPAGTGLGGNGGASPAAGTAGGNGVNGAAAGGGAAGGGISTANAASNGGGGGLSYLSGNLTTSGAGAAGVVDTTLPGSGTSPTVEGTPCGGGGGGAASLNAASYSFTATNATPCVFTATGSAYSNGAILTLTGGSLPAGFLTATNYFVVSASGTTFSLAPTSGGAAINSTSTGSGTVNGTGPQAGGAGIFGGGGGGGGASVSGTTSGGGGQGGPGFCLAISLYQ